jgi:hypothetical protein
MTVKPTDFNKFNESARRAIFFARHMAYQTQYVEVAPEHLLYGVACADKPIADKFFLNQKAIKYAILNLFESKSPKDMVLSYPSLMILRNANAIFKDRITKTNGTIEAKDKPGTAEILLALVREQGKPGFKSMTECLRFTRATQKIVESWYAETHNFPINQDDLLEKFLIDAFDAAILNENIDPKNFARTVIHDALERVVENKRQQAADNTSQSPAPAPSGE